MNEQLKIIISAEVAKFKQNVDDAKKKIKDFVKTHEKELEEAQATWDTVGEKSKGALKVMGGAIAGAATALLTLAGTTKEYRTQQAQLSTAFQAAGGSAETAKKTYNDLYRVLGDSGKATEAAQHLAKLTTNEKELSEWTNICKGVYATFGESIPIESLTEAVNHSAKLGEVQGTLADALEWSGINVDEFNEQLFWCNSESEREKLIRDTLNGEYAEAAATYEETAGAVMDQNTAQQQLNDAMAALGEATAPILTMLTQLLVDILEPLTPKIQEFVEKYGPTIEETLVKVADAIGKVIGWIADNWELVSTLAIIIAGISAALTVFSTVMAIVNAVMLASPVTWIVLAIVAAIALLTAGIILVIKYWDEIKGAAAKAWNFIKDVWNKAASWFNEKVVQPVINVFNNLKESITAKIQSIKDGVTNTFNKIKDAITKPIEKARDTIKTIIDKIKGFFDFDFKLPKLKTPKFSITPSGWELGDLLKGVIPKLGITWNARGGVFDKPTIMGYGGSLQGLGENGAEAVVPLENNLEWLDKLATMLANKLDSDRPVVLTVDGKVFAKTAIRTINANTKQTGKLALNIM